MTIKPRQTVIIEFKKEVFPLRSGVATVLKVLNQHCFTVELNGQTVILDTRKHGKEYTVKELHHVCDIRR